MTFTWAISAVVIVLGLVVVALVVMRRASASDAALVVDQNGRAAWVEDDSFAEVVERDPHIHWPQMVAHNSGPLDDEARLRLINDLALVRAPWCVAILQRAYEEEREPTLRCAVGAAIEACGTEIHARPAISSVENAVPSGGERRTTLS